MDAAGLGEMGETQWPAGDVARCGGQGEGVDQRRRETAVPAPPPGRPKPIGVAEYGYAK